MVWQTNKQTNNNNGDYGYNNSDGEKKTNLEYDKGCTRRREKCRDLEFSWIVIERAREGASEWVSENGNALMQLLN